MGKKLNREEIDAVLANGKLRKSLAYEDPLWFSLIYLRHHFEFPFAPFHREMFYLLQNDENQFIVVMAFRESGKSAILNLANILWSILGKQRRKFVVVVSKTQDQAKSHFANLKEELLHNELLRQDFGPFAENERDWKKMSLELEYHDSKIMCISMEQSVRGLKYRAVRPDLIICDDVEDISDAQEQLSQEVTRTRFSSEILPLGSGGTRIVVLGNLLSQDSLTTRLGKEIEDRRIDGVFRAYPLIDDAGRVLWKDKYGGLEKVRQLSKRYPLEVWTREFLLRPLEFINGKLPRPILEKGPVMMRGKEMKVRSLKIQRALLPQMERFRISVPLGMLFLPIIMSEDNYRKTLGNVLYFYDRNELL